MRDNQRQMNKFRPGFRVHVIFSSNIFFILISGPQYLIVIYIMQIYYTKTQLCIMSRLVSN